MFISKKKYEAEMQSLKHEIKELQEIVKTQELIKLRAENERLKEKEKLIRCVKFKLKDVAYLTEDNIVLVKYEVPFVKVGFDDKGEIMKNDMFFAINKLQLLPLEDLKKIKVVVDQAKKQN